MIDDSPVAIIQNEGDHVAPRGFTDHSRARPPSGVPGYVASSRWVPGKVSAESSAENNARDSGSQPANPRNHRRDH